MKARKLFALVLALVMTLSVATVLTSAVTVGDIEAIDAVEEYGNGKVILDESKFKDNIAGNFSTNGNTGTVSWNAETDRLKLVSTANMITDITAIPANLVNYTIQADIIVSAGSSKKLGLGINSTQEWGKGTYIQIQTGNAWAYMNNSITVNKPNTVRDANVGAVTPSMTYVIGDRITMKLVVSTTHVIGTIHYNGVDYTFTNHNAKGGCDLSKLGAIFGSGAPFFNQGGGTTMEVDNLMVWAGTGAPATVNAELVGRGLYANDTLDMRFLVKYNESPAAMNVSATVAGEAVQVAANKFEGTNGKTGEVYGADSHVYEYVVSVSAKQLTDEIVLSVKNGEDVLLSNTYTVNGYCNDLIAAAEADGATAGAKSAADVAAAIQLYGYTAQLYFNYNVSNLPTLNKEYLAALAQ